MKKFISVSICILSIAADICTLYVGLKSLLQNIIENPPTWLLTIAYLLLLFGTFYAIFYIVLSFFDKRCEKCGTHKIPCSYFAYFSAKLLNKTQKSLHAMHMIYHEAHHAKQQILKDRQKYNNFETSKPLVEEYLSAAIAALQHALGLDVKASVKNALQDDCDFFLQTYTYVVPKMDENIDRDINSKYIILMLDDNSPQDLLTWCNASIKYAKKYGNGKYLSNSIFNYLLRTGKPFWMSNDLDIDEKNHIFYTSSSYRPSYKSLAVFLIMKPKEKGQENASDIKGILTFESHKTNVFVEKECVQIMGFIAHCLYEVLTEIRK